MDYKVEIDNEIFEFDTLDIDAIQIDDSSYHVLEGGQAYQIDIVEANFATKEITLEVNGNKYTVVIKDKFDQLINKLGLSAVNSQKLKNVKVPMPGLIVDILVEEGQSITKGDQLLILEAMKMENVIKAEGDGVVKSILTQKGTPVDKGQVIIEME